MSRDPLKPTAHARHVAKLCERLFAATGHLHGLTKPALRLLERAALVHDLGSAKPPTRCPGAAVRTGKLFHQALGDLAADERRLVAHALAASHLGRQVGTQRAAVGRGRERAALEIAWRLGAILRIADALDSWRRQEANILAVADDGTGVEIVVSGGRTATADAHAALRKADLWNAVALRPIRAIRVSEQPGGAAPLVSPGDTMAEAAPRLLRRQFEQFAAREHGLPYERDIEYVHEMRVALRRFLAILRITRKALGADFGAIRDAVTWLVDALGVVRDLDVFAAFLRRTAREAPRKHREVLRRLIRAEQRKRQRGYQALLAQCHSERCDALRRELEALFPAAAPPRAQAGPPEETVAQRAPRALRRRLGRVLAFGARLDKLAPEDQHALRIACKRLRYTAETFGSIYPEGLAEIIGPMVKLQDALGDVHDADVYRERIERYARSHGRDRGAKGALAALLAHLESWRGDSLREAADVWRGFRSRKAQRRLEELIDSPMEG